MTPCDIKKIEKGYHCVGCKRELTQDDVRNSVCKRCETKPATTEYCVRTAGVVFVPECHPERKSDKPVS